MAGEASDRKLQMCFNFNLLPQSSSQAPFTQVTAQVWNHLATH